MEKEISKDLLKIKKKEQFQARMTSYITKIGKWLLFLLPLILVLITIITFIIGVPEATTFWQQELPIQILTVVFYVVLGIYFLNSIMLLLGATATEISLHMRLDFERKRGRPIDALDGFELLHNNVQNVINLLKMISIVCIVSLVLFIIMLWMGDLTLGFAAMGFALIGLGLALLIRSLNLNIHDVNGLQDFYKPTTHQMFLDNFFAEIFSNHLDPVTFLKWDEYMAGINKILTSSFIKKIKEQEPDEMPITFALEKILFLYYLKYQNVLSEEIFIQELKEVINVDSLDFDVERGLLIEGSYYFSKEDIYNLFNYIKIYNPGFFSIIDRLQLELADNIERLSQDPIYMDSCAQELCLLDGELNIMIFLFNNHPDSKRYRIKVIAPGFDPKEVVLNVEVEGRGSFRIPDKPIPLSSAEGTDICGILANMLENGDTTWITLEPRAIGEQTIQVFLETSDGIMIEGKTRTVKVSKNLKQQLKKLSSLGSVLGGLAVPLSRVLLPLFLI
ncbi:MAG: hypothetical protein ACTSQJ_04240 [Promethearchaeota archaeon]